MKKCYKCDTVKPFTDFYKSTRDGYGSRCKACEKIYNQERWQRRKHEPCVYYLPEHHYIGVSSMIEQRLYEHKSSGKITEGYEILCYFEREVDAAWMEIQFHQRGYNGFRKL